MDTPHFLVMLRDNLLPVFCGLETLITALSFKGVIAALVLCWIVYWLWVPACKITKADEMGWLSKSEIKKIRSRRKIGNIPPVYPNGWYVIAESSQLKNQEVIYVPALGEHFAVFRTENGEVKILDAYCPHLGANMGVGGKVQGDCLECPFHRWQFSGETGDCTHIPFTEKVPKTAKVKRWISLERYNCIFVWYHAEDENPNWDPPEINGFKTLSLQAKLEAEINCHVQEFGENTSDLTHFKTLHRPMSLSGSDLRSYANWQWFFNNNFEATWDTSNVPGEEHISKMTIKHRFTLLGKTFTNFGYGEANSLQVGPGLIILNSDLIFGKMIVIMAMTPMEPLLQKMTQWIYAPFYLAPIVKSLILWDLATMMKRDAVVMCNKTYTTRPVLIKEEANIAKFRKWFTQFYTEHSITYQMAKSGIEW